MDKKSIRSRIVNARDAMLLSEVHVLSLDICSKALSLPQVSNSGSIGIYLSFRNEVAAEMLLSYISESGRKAFAPLVLDGGLKFAKIASLKDATPSDKGPREPNSKAFADKGSIGTYIVPGVAFDINGNRVGWGSGHYDRFLSECSGAVKIGLAYDFQVIDRLEPEAHDVKMDFIVTEKRVIRI